MPLIVSKKTANLVGLVFVLLSIIGIIYLAFTQAEPKLVISTVSDLNSGGYIVFSFVCLALVSQFLVIPSGSILMIGGGFLLGSLPAALIYTALLPITGIIIGLITASSSLNQWVDTLLRKYSKAAKIIELLKNEPFTLSAVLRLTPVIPAAIAAIVASTLKVRHTTFICATLCVGWIRPLFFASIGGAAQSLTQFQDDPFSINDKSILALSLLAISAMLNLLVRCWLRWRRESATG